MRKLAKIAAAPVFAAVMTAALTGCGGNQSSSVQQSVNSAAQSGGTGGNTPADIVDDLSEHTTRSKVTSADSSAILLANTVNTWILENQSCGELMPGEGEETIVFDNENVTVSGVITDADKAEMNSQTLSQRLGEEYSTETFWAKVYIGADGRVSGVVYVGGATSADGLELPGKDALAAGSWKWNGKTAGVTPSGKIVGTYPRVQLAAQ